MASKKPKVLGTGLRAEPNVESWKLEESRVIAEFEKSGRLVFNGMADYLPVIINYCEQNRINYVLDVMPRRLYSIWKK